MVWSKGVPIIMTMRPTPILDIRYFESNAPVEYGKASASYLGSLYPYPKANGLFTYAGARFALKLADVGFRLPGFDHVYVCLTPALPRAKAVLCEFVFETWMRYVSVGMPPSEWDSLDEDGKFCCLVSLTSVGLKQFCQQYGLSIDPVIHVEASMRNEKTDLEIEHLRKETSAYLIRVTYQIAPRGGRSIAYVEYVDKKMGRKGKVVLTRLAHHDDIRPLVSSLSVSGGVIRVKPRTSALASFTTRQYPVPLEVPIEQVVAAGDDDYRQAAEDNAVHKLA